MHSSTLEAAIVVVIAVVFLHLIVVNWSGDEIARLEVQPSDTVVVGMRQIQEQLGVPVTRQMLVCGEDALEKDQTWSTYLSVRDWSTIQLTTMEQDFDAASDREALMVLFDNCGGAAWTNNTNWGSGEALSSWEGVEVDERGRVRRLQLGEIGMSGVIPDEIGNLTALERLDLSGNHLIGCIPIQLSQLTALSDLALLDNDLTGGIPSELGNLTNLWILHLGGNQLTSIPRELSNLTELVELRLGSNSLAGDIPPRLSRRSTIEEFFLNQRYE